MVAGVISAIKGSRSKPARAAGKQTHSQQPGQTLQEFNLPLQSHISTLDDSTLSLDFNEEDSAANEEFLGGSLSSHGKQLNKRSSRGKGECHVGRLVIRADSPPGQRAPTLERALRTLLRRCYPAAVSCQVSTALVS